ncbi:MAG: hypothetical protein Q7U04_05020 [Bacteriovorax sp.]|nr:hypothetical protein [Bacteriovorax sp.]
MNEKYLKIFLYWFIDKKNINEDFEEKFIESFRRNYTPKEQSGIINSLKWALDNKQLNFRSMLPGIKVNNDTIIKHISSVIQKL